MNEDGADATARNSQSEVHLEPSPLGLPNGEHSYDDQFARDYGRSKLGDPLNGDLQYDKTRSSAYGYNLEAASSSSSSSQLSGAIYAEGDESADEGGQSRRHGSMSSHSSISSLPGSVVVYPPGKMTGLPFAGYSHDPSNMPANNHPGSRKPGRPPRYDQRMRDRSSPFRHPSSVLAMQMDDETWDGSEAGFDTLTPSRKRDWMREKASRQSPSFSEMTTGSRRSGKSSGSPHHRPSSRTKSPQIKQGQQQPQSSQEQAKEYPLVLLHCTLLRPSLSLPRALGTPSPQLLKEVLPPQYWQRWKLLEDKVVGSGLLCDRGVLISHPQEAYDLLEERLLESLELVRPRVAYGHFLGREEDSDGGEANYDTRDDSRSTCDDESEHTCTDCGQRIESSERKWDVKVYAANGLMRAGAWAAAWREMEKVDVEVSVWLPTEVKQELERRMTEEDAAKHEAERRMAEEEERRREIYGDLTGPSHEELDGLEDGEYSTQHTPDTQHDTGQTPYEGPPETKQNQPSARDFDLRLALTNYLRLLANDPRNAALFFMALLVLFFAMNAANLGISTNLAAQGAGAHPIQASLSPTLGDHLSSTLSDAITATATPTLQIEDYVDPPSSQATPASSSAVSHDETSFEPSPINQAAETAEVPVPDDPVAPAEVVVEPPSDEETEDYEDSAPTDPIVPEVVLGLAEPPTHSEED